MQFPLPATVATYYPGEMIGMDINGYAVKFDDAASVLFLGINAESVRIDVVSADAAADKKIKVQRPKEGFAMTIAAAVLTDVGKKVYAKFSNEVQYSGATYGNFAGTVKEYLTATTVLIQPPSWGDRYPAGVSRVMAATGAQSLTKFDLNKTIILPNTGAYALTLPAVADTQAGDFFDFIKTTASATAVTLTGAGAETINGSNTLAQPDAQYETLRLVSTGTVWIVTCKNYS